MLTPRAMQKCRRLRRPEGLHGKGMASAGQDQHAHQGALVRTQLRLGSLLNSWLLAALKS